MKVKRECDVKQLGCPPTFADVHFFAANQQQTLPVRLQVQSDARYRFSERCMHDLLSSREIQYEYGNFEMLSSQQQSRQFIGEGRASACPKDCCAA